MSTPRDRLEDVVSEGLIKDLFQAEEALHLNELIGREAKRINEATFGIFFSSLQIILGRYLTLAVARLYDKSQKRYKIRSIPAAIDILRENAGTLKVERWLMLNNCLLKLGFARHEIEQLSDKKLTELIADYFAEHLSLEGIHSLNAVTKGLSALNVVRNKVIAHREAVPLESLRKPTYAEIDKLISFAKRFVTVVGFAYLGHAYEDDKGNYLLSTDATRAMRNLRRLLRTAGVIPKEQKVKDE